MKMVYLLHHRVIETEHIGIRKKMAMQMNAFQKAGFEPIYIVFDEYRMYVQDRTGKVPSKMEYFESEKMGVQIVLETIKELAPKFVYMRYRFIENYYTNNFYQELKNTGIPIIYEFYTFPYDKEFPEGDSMIACDRFYRSRISQYTNMSTNYTGYKEILGVPSFDMINGVDVDEIPLHKTLAKNKEIHLIAIATMHFWHGYDRLIEGLHHYYESGPKDYCLKLYLVGKGAESSRYHEMIQQYHLEEYIYELGRITEKEKLDQLFDGMDLAIGSLGMHRLHLESASPIKAAEYCARGIPFVIGYKDISFASDFEYQLNIEENDNPIDCSLLVDFYNRINIERAAYEMRTYATEHLTWDTQLKKMLEEFGIIS